MYQSILEEAINLKLKEFKGKDINVSYVDIKKYLRNVYFRKKEISREELIKFVYEDNIESIISFLMSDAIINPKF